MKKAIAFQVFASNGVYTHPTRTCPPITCPTLTVEQIRGFFDTATPAFQRCIAIANLNVFLNEKIFSRDCPCGADHSAMSRAARRVFKYAQDLTQQQREALLSAPISFRKLLTLSRKTAQNPGLFAAWLVK